MKVRREYMGGYLATTALIGFLVSFCYNGAVTPKSLVEGFVLTAIIFGSGVAWSIIEERNK